ncbi:MAG: 7-cyano-7-deazaguanine synthase QueC [Thermoplasmata archaeon]|nr:7-cyano-7-deazaguanine synthase QueC [Thermoplasmata archaeon]TFG68415.1 MAG: 7-cyano-7-deazaguanine synthase QueC [Methanomassiliicoccus sp.]
MTKSVVLLSGGLDSSTVLAMARSKGHDVIALTFDYGQRHARELESARKVASHLGCSDHLIIRLPIGEFLFSSLTDSNERVPEGRTHNEMAEGIPNTYVPARNIIFLSIGASIAESMGAESVFIAANAVDYSGYPDCTPEFIESFQRMLDVGTKVGRAGRGIRIEAPIIKMSKGDIVRTASQLGVPLELTWSCYKGNEMACGRCDSCTLRLQGFSEAGLKDPLEYEVIE